MRRQRGAGSPSRTSQTQRDGEGAAAGALGDPKRVTTQPMTGIDPAVTEYYERAPEESRLEQGAFQLEQVRTRELIERHAPPPPATALDVGGAAGAYAFWLAERGYAVHLIDAVPRLVEEARRRSEERRVGKECRSRWSPYH